MSDPIDYSRPVGWWCPVCDRQHRPDVVSVDCPPPIPVFLPIPEGQRPLVENEVESAEVVTLTAWGTGWYACRDGSFARWVDGIEIAMNTEHHINVIAHESARIVTGATE